MKKLTQGVLTGLSVLLPIILSLYQILWLLGIVTKQADDDSRLAQIIKGDEVAVYLPHELSARWLHGSVAKLSA